MDQLLNEPTVPIPDHMSEGIGRAVQHVAATGASWTGRQRVGFARAARAATAGITRSSDTDLPPDAVDTARKIATEAHAMTVDDVSVFANPAVYVEIVGVVARTAAIDTVARGVGSSAVALLDGKTDEPSGELAIGAKRRSALVPTVGAAGPRTGLSLVPSEAAAQADLHEVLYLSYAEMRVVDIHKGLPRWQFELVAARTSLVNECFF